MSAMGSSALVGGMVFARELYHYWVPRKVGVYGPPMTGKTTLDYSGRDGGYSSG